MTNLRLLGYLALAGAAIALGGCATDASNDLEDREYTLVETGPGPTKTERDTIPVSDDVDDPVICKRIQRTGTRFTTRTCAKKSEWDAMEEGSEDFLRTQERQGRVGRPGG
ncbi:MAG: hypothetical protein AAGJ29_08585 [Pseudomonadota bacterium]